MAFNSKLTQILVVLVQQYDFSIRRFLLILEIFLPFKIIQTFRKYVNFKHIKYEECYY